MFAILKTSENNKILRKPEIKCQRVNLPSGDAFFIVTTDKHRGKVPFKKLSDCLGILKKDIIPDDSISLPETSDITLFTPDIFPRLLLMNSAVDYITKHKSEFISKTLTISDEKGIYQNYIEKLLNTVSHIKIITTKPESYKTVSEILMKNYGFSLIVTNKETFESDVIISHKQKAPLYFKGTVFTNEPCSLLCGRVLTSKDISLPKEYENLNICNTDPLLFASALYEKCGCSDLTTLKYTRFIDL